MQEVIELGCAAIRKQHRHIYRPIGAICEKNAGYANYLPSVSGSASAGRDYRNKDWGDWNYGASLSASYLIFDFGKRLADLNTLAATWRATGFDYDESVQNYVYGVIGAYYALLNADA